MINFSFTFDAKKALEKISSDRKVAEFIDNQMTPLSGLLETEVKRDTPVLTGNLQSSIIGKKTGFMQAEVGTNVKYARYVEYGTSRFQPRAMFRKGVVSFKALAQQFLEQKIKDIQL